jgi:hypothetical protein
MLAFNPNKVIFFYGPEFFGVDDVQKVPYLADFTHLLLPPVAEGSKM